MGGGGRGAMPRGHRLLIGREVAGEIFPGPPPRSPAGLSALASSPAFLWLECVGGPTGTSQLGGIVHCA